MMASSMYQPMSLTPQLDIDARSHAAFFAPPQTPSITDSLRRSTYSASTANTSASRKRLRDSYDLSNYKLSNSGWSTALADSPSSSTFSPVPLTNSRYLLAGGLDTPTAANSILSSRYDAPSDLSYRNGSEWSCSVPPSQYHSQESTGLARERNGHARLHTPVQAHSSWGMVVLSSFTGVAGAVASSVWNFCTAGAFRGFHAGEAQGHGLKTQPETETQSHRSFGRSRCMLMDGEDDCAQHLEESGTPTMTPGAFPEQDLILEYMSDPDAWSMRAAKKQKSTHGGDGEIRNNWVMVDRDGSPLKHKPPRPSIASPASVRQSPVPPRSSASRRSIITDSRPSMNRTASHVGVRSPHNLSPPSRNANRSPTRLHSCQNSTDGFTASSPLRRQSTQAKRGSFNDSGQTGPVSVEAQRFIERQAKREKEEDRKIRRFNAQLEDLIREGREALGTKIEVVDADDEGDEPY